MKKRTQYAIRNTQYDKNKVSIVGAGPGDPGLITVKGLERVKTADVILYDRLIPRGILAHRKADCLLKYAGKRKGKVAMSQDEINAALLKSVLARKRVVRLKGGDPFIFGRGSEEVSFLRSYGIECEVVPGVSSFYAAAGACGIPITHRGLAAGFMVVTGHESPSKKERGKVDWKSAARFEGTLVVLMGKSNLKEIAGKLVEGGMKEDTACAVVSQGTTKKQEAAFGTICDIAGKAGGIPSPAVVIIGAVAKLGPSREAGAKPLSGKRYLLTASEKLNSDLGGRIKELGGKVDSVSMIKIRENKDHSLVDEVIRDVKDYDWLVFTSRHGVEYFLKRFSKMGGRGTTLRGKTACVGTGTAAELKRRGVTPSLFPDKFTAVDLARALRRKGIKGKRIALLRTKMKKDHLKSILNRAGARVTDCIVYNVEDANDRKRVEKAIAERPDGVFFLSPRSAYSFFNSIPEHVKEDFKKRSSFFSIGTVTTRVLKKNGIDRINLPAEHTVAGLVKLCVEADGARNQKPEHRNRKNGKQKSKKRYK